MFRQTFDSALIVNKTCTISNFQVQKNDLMFKASNHKFLLKFTSGTTVGDYNKYSIHGKVIKFTSFVDIISEKWQTNLLIGIPFNFRMLHIRFYISMNSIHTIFLPTYVIGTVDEVRYS